MNKILYLGNKLEVHGKAPTSADILPKLLNYEEIRVKVCSTQKNKILRFLDFTYHIIFYGLNSQYVLIDTYSTLNFWYAIWCGFLCRLFGVKYIPVLRGGNLGDRLIKNKNIARSYFQKSHINIAPSEFLERIFRKSNIKNIKYIPNTIVLSNYDFRRRRDIKPKILWVRAFDKVYNPTMAVLALEQLLAIYPKAGLCMVGPEKDGSLKKLREVVARKNLPVIFKGKLDKKEWIALSKEYDIFLNTTTIDNTPVSVIEAMALGFPVVSTNVGGIPYLISNEENGILVGSKNVDEMVYAIDRLLKDPQLTESLSLHARKEAEKFDWHKVKYKWLELLG